MSNVTKGPKLNKLINANEADNYVDAFREFLRACDQHIMPAVLSTGVTVPPTSPANGDAYIVGSGASGSWAGQDHNIAVWSAEITMSDTNTKVPGWEFYIPNEGWTVWDAALRQSQWFTSGSWTTALGGFSDEEVPQGSVDGVNVVYAISKLPNPISSFKLYSGGVRLTRGDDFTGSADYTLTNYTIQYRNPPVANTLHVCDYRY